MLEVNFSLGVISFISDDIVYITKEMYAIMRICIDFLEKIY